MKVITFLLVLLGFTVQAQFDTLTVKSSWYGRIMPYTLYTGYGVIADRVSQSFEVGRSYGVMDFGLSYGRISLRPDSSQFVEAKVTMDACQIGIFSNEFTVGFGHVFNPNTPYMFELSSTLFAQVGKDWGVGVVTGYYDISGDTYSNTKNYVGLYFRIGLLRSEGGFLMHRRFKVRHHR